MAEESLMRADSGAAVFTPEADSVVQTLERQWPELSYYYLANFNHIKSVLLQ